MGFPAISRGGFWASTFGCQKWVSFSWGDVKGEIQVVLFHLADGLVIKN